MGGLGSVIGGAKSSEDILFGMAAGAMVGALNFGENHVTQEEQQKQQIEKIATVLGLNGEATKILLESVESAAKYGKAAEMLGKLTEVVAKLSGVPIALISVGKAINDPTSANIVAAITNSALVLAGPELSILSGILDVTGVSDKVYNFVGTKTDTSIDHISDIFHNSNQSLNGIVCPANWVNP